MAPELCAACQIFGDFFRSKFLFHSLPFAGLVCDRVLAGWTGVTLGRWSHREMLRYRSRNRTASEPGLRAFDILIVDEAHNAAPSGAGNFALDSQRTQALREIGKHFAHKLFLTATPHNGYKESFSALLELLDDQGFARSVAPDPAQLRAVMVRRLKSEIKNWDGSDKFPRRTLEHIPVDYTAEEQRIHALLRCAAPWRCSSPRSTAPTARAAAPSCKVSPESTFTRLRSL